MLVPGKRGLVGSSLRRLKTARVFARPEGALFGRSNVQFEKTLANSFAENAGALLKVID